MIAFLLLIAVIKGLLGLRLVRIDVPTAVILGNPFWLNCTYNLEGDFLYSVKWYKNNVEFYRYLPSDIPPAQKYDLKGVNVDLSKSSLGNIYLGGSTQSTEGKYRCEVSTESPSFHSVREEKELSIYVLPQEGPRLTGTRPQYHVRDRVNSTCISGPSKPAATLKWYVNGKKAPEEWIYYLPSIPYPEKLLSSVMRLTFEVESEHLQNGLLKLRCMAVISQAYSMSSEEIIVGDNASPYEIQHSEEGDGPTITGGLPKYQFGDTVNVNCTASRSKPPAELQWYLNDRKAPIEHYLYYEPIIYQDGLKSSVLGLRFTVRPSDFKGNEILLKCTATHSKVINMSNEGSVIGSSQQSSLLHIFENIGSKLNGAKLKCTPAAPAGLLIPVTFFFVFFCWT